MSIDQGSEPVVDQDAVELSESAVLYPCVNPASCVVVCDDPSAEGDGTDDTCSGQWTRCDVGYSGYGNLM